MVGNEANRYIRRSIDQGSGQVVCVSLALILLAFAGASPISQLLLRLMTLEPNLINELTFMYVPWQVPFSLQYLHSRFGERLPRLQMYQELNIVHLH